MSAPLGVGVVGLGFMGRTHLAAYRAADAAGFQNRLVAVCDGDPERRAGRPAAAGNLGGADDAPLFDADSVRATDDADELLADPEVELVSLCTPTDTHVDLALRALAAGKHVLVEKPVALRAAEAQRLADAARASDRLCMPAMCMRFWPGWDWLKERVDDGALGAVKSAVFRRLGTRPGWSPTFYADPERTGGALFDLHVHDADIVRWCFGEPDEVRCAGTLDHLTATYRFAGGPPHVACEGGWDHAPGFPFTMAYTVVFEGGTADWRLGREPALVLARGGRAEPVPLADEMGYDGEVRHLLHAIATGSRELRATVDEAVGLVRMLEAARAQLA